MQVYFTIFLTGVTGCRDAQIGVELSSADSLGRSFSLYRYVFHVSKSTHTSGQITSMLSGSKMGTECAPAEVISGSKLASVPNFISDSASKFMMSVMPTLWLTGTVV